MPRHGMLTWGDLLTRLYELSPEELQDTVTVQEGLDEFSGIRAFGVSKDGDAADGILDAGHLYLIPGTQGG